MFFLFRVCFFIVFVIGIVFFIYISSNFVNSRQAFINANLTNIATSINGNLSIQELKDGEFLNKDKVLFKVINPHFSQNESTAQYNNLLNSIDRLKQEMITEKIQLEKLKADYDRFQALYKTGAVSLMEFEDIASQLKIVKTSIKEKDGHLEHLNERLLEAKKQRLVQKSFEAVMPFDGTLWALFFQDNEYVSVKDTIVQVVDRDSLFITAFFHEKDIHHLKVNDKVNIRLIGSKLSWTGHIDFIRGGVGKINYDASIAIPATNKKRLVAVQIRADLGEKFSEKEFYGIGRSLLITYKKKKYAKADLFDKLKNLFNW